MTKYYRPIVISAGLAQVLAFIVYLAMAAYVIPFWDTLDWIGTYYASDSLAPWLWQQHADVRQPVVKFLLWLDLRLLEGTFYPIAAVCVFSMLLCVGAIARLAHANMKSPAGRALAVGIPLVLCFQTFTLPSYMETSLVQHILVVVFLIGAVWPFICAGSNQPPTARAYVVAAAGAVLASLTFPNGLLAWPILAWLAWRRGAATLCPIALILAGIVTGLLYFDGYRWVEATPGAFSFHHAVTILRFILEFFSVPWIRVPVLYPLGIAVGAAILVTGAFMALRIGARQHDPVSDLAIALLIFTVGTALMTAIARAEILDLRTQGTRYGIYAAIAQLAVALYVLPLVDRIGVGIANRSRMLALIGVVLVLGLAA